MSFIQEHINRNYETLQTWLYRSMIAVTLLIPIIGIGIGWSKGFPEPTITYLGYFIGGTFPDIRNILAVWGLEYEGK